MRSRKEREKGGKKVGTATEHFHNPGSSPAPSHFYERSQHKIPSTRALFALRNKKGGEEDACDGLSHDGTRGKRRGLAKGKGHADIILVQL